MNNPPPNRHVHFFSSLKQVEKRLKLEKPGTHISISTPNSTLSPSTESSLSSPLFLNINPTKNSTFNDDTESIAREFLTNSYTSPQTQQNPLPESPQHSPRGVNFDVDDIGLLIDLLGLSDSEGNSGLEKCCSCKCEGGFYERIVGVKGPKCGKEVERLEGWVEWFRRENGEPLRLAHLLLGKAAFVSSEGFEGIEFPSPVKEFLQSDPPLG